MFTSHDHLAVLTCILVFAVSAWAFLHGLRRWRSYTKRGMLTDATLSEFDKSNRPGFYVRQQAAFAAFVVLAAFVAATTGIVLVQILLSLIRNVAS